MFCTNCGAENKEEAKFCVKCGEPFGEVKAGGKPGTPQPSIAPSSEPFFLKGLWVVFKSFFSLPYKFVIDTFVVIKKIGKEGKVLLEGTDVPFLNWLFTTGRVLIILISIIIIFIAFVLGLIVLASGGGGYGGRDVGSRFFSMIFVWIAGVILAFIQVWLSALWLELVSLAALLVNNTKRISNLLEKSGPKEND
jgi:hypothetical protein